MPVRITAHGIEAQALRHNDGRIYELTSPAGKEGYAHQTGRRCWEHYADADSLMRGASLWHAPFLDTLLQGVGDSFRRGISVAQIDQLNQKESEVHYNYAAQRAAHNVNSESGYQLKILARNLPANSEERQIIETASVLIDRIRNDRTAEGDTIVVLDQQEAA